MKILFFLLMLSAWLFPAYGQEIPGYVNLPPRQFSEELKSVSDPMLVDVREYFEYRRMKIPGAVNIPSFGKYELSMDSIDRSTYLFFYCTGGTRSSNVAKVFSENGYPHVYNLEGGIKAWRKEGLRVDRKK